MAKRDRLLLWELIGQHLPDSKQRFRLCGIWKLLKNDRWHGSVADELIVGVKLRWKMVEMTEAMVSHTVADLLHSAKIIPTPTPTAAQLCVVTLGDMSGNRSRWKKLVQIILQIIRHFCWQRDREWQEREGTKEGQQGGEGVEAV